MRAKIWNSAYWVRLEDGIVEALGAVLDKAGFGVLGMQRQHFMPEGLTCLWLLSESHLALHTWPEHGVAYVELSSCNEAKSGVFAQAVAQQFVVESEKGGEHEYAAGAGS